MSANDQTAVSFLMQARRTGQFLGPNSMEDAASRVLQMQGVSDAVRADALSLRAFARAEGGRIDGALADLAEQVKLGDYPDKGLHLAEAHLRRARLLRARNDHVAVIEACTSALAVPNAASMFRGEALGRRGVARLKLNDVEGARSDLTQAVTMATDDCIKTFRDALAARPPPPPPAPPAKWWEFWKR